MIITLAPTRIDERNIVNMLRDRLLLMGRLDEKHAFTGKEVAEVISELKQEFAFADLRPNSQGGG